MGVWTIQKGRALSVKKSTLSKASDPKTLYLSKIAHRDFEVLKLQYFKLLCALSLSETYSELSQTSEMELFAENR